MDPNAPTWNQQQQQQRNMYAQQQPGYNPYAQQPAFNAYGQQQAYMNQGYNPYAQQQLQAQPQPPQPPQQQHYQPQQQYAYNANAQHQPQVPQQPPQQPPQHQQYQYYQQQPQQPQQQQQQPPPAQQPHYSQYQQQEYNNNSRQQHPPPNMHNNQAYDNVNNNNRTDNWEDDDNDQANQPQYGRVRIAQHGGVGGAEEANANANANASKGTSLDDSDDETNSAQQGPKKKRKRRAKKKKTSNAEAAAAENNSGPEAKQAPQSQPEKAPPPRMTENAEQVETAAKDSPSSSVAAVQDATDSLEKMSVKTDAQSESPSVESAGSFSFKSSASKPKVLKTSSKPSKPSKPSAEVEKKEKATKEKPAKEKRKNVVWDAHDQREHFNLVLIGHVDAGKSTISGQILLVTGQIDERVIAKYKKEAKEKNRESWWIAYIMDEDDDERNKGKTVECGRAHFDTSSRRYTILDAPGHKNYVPNMISGAQCADVAILVISARKGEFEAGFDRGGQTREHGLLAKTLGIQRVVVVVNKMDCCAWKKERFDEIEKRVAEFLTGLGYKDKYVSFLPISGQDAVNINSKVSPSLCSWYQGPTLLEQLDSLKKIKRPIGDDLRITVLDRYKGDKGVQAIGKVEAGVVRKGDSVRIMPTEVTCDVADLSIDDQPVETVGAGENILISFEKGALSMDHIYSGCVICSLQKPTKVIEEFEAEIYIHEVPGGIMTVGYKAMFHAHNISTLAEITALSHKLHKKTMKRSRAAPSFLRSHERAIVRLRLDQKCALEAYDDCPALGRFTLRDQGKTVVIGKISEVFASKSRLKDKGNKGAAVEQKADK